MTSFSESPITSLCCIILLRQSQEFPLLIPVRRQPMGEDFLHGDVEPWRIVHDGLDDVRGQVDQGHELAEHGPIDILVFGELLNRHRRMLLPLVEEPEARDEPPADGGELIPVRFSLFFYLVEDDRVSFAPDEYWNGDFEVPVDEFAFCTRFQSHGLPPDEPAEGFTVVFDFDLIAEQGYLFDDGLDELVFFNGEHDLPDLIEVGE